MTEILRLHYAPDNASLIVRLALEELGLQYETVLVDRSTHAQNSPAYLAINPAGLIPALETPDGPLFETGAILLWLSDRYEGLAPSVGSCDRGAFLKWLFYMSNTVHPNLRMSFYPDKYVGEDTTCQAALRTQVQANLGKSLSLFESLAAENHSWFSTQAPSSLTLYLAAILRWMALYPQGQTDWFGLTDWPNLSAIARNLETRDSVAALCAAEGMEPAPFTRPTAPNPPEGVAL